LDHVDARVSHGGEVEGGQFHSDGSVEGGRFHDDDPDFDNAWVHQVTPRDTAVMSHPPTNCHSPSPPDVAVDMVSPLMSRCPDPAVTRVGISMAAP
jgi:hypothetical protein